MVVKYICLLMLFLFVGCLDTYDYDFKDFEQQLVLYCILDTDESPTLRLSKTIDPSSATQTELSDIYVEDASIYLLLENNVIDTFIYVGNGLYQLKRKSIPKSGHSYSINLISSEFGELKTEEVLVPYSTVRVSGMIDSMDCITLYNDFIGCNANLKFSYNDYYVLLEYNPIPELENEAAISSTLINDVGCQELEFWNKRVISTQCQKSLDNLSYYIPYKLVGKQYKKHTYDEYRFEISSISPSYYSYLKVLEEQSNYESYLLFEPTLTYSNIIGGLGLLGARNDTTILLFPK